LLIGILMYASHCSELKKLSEESLTRQPEEVFDIICKLGEGSYGSVYKALHKESDQVSSTKNSTGNADETVAHDFGLF
jgi:serine/threonine kinase 3